MDRSLSLVIVLLLAPLAGCLTAPGADSPFGGDDAGATDVAPGTFTANVTETDATCKSGTQRPCAARDVLVAGAINIARLPVSLDTWAGGVNVIGGPAGAWSLLAHLEAEGATADEARENLERLSLEWTIDEDGKDVLRAVVVRSTANGVQLPVSTGTTEFQARGVLTLIIPQNIVLDLAAKTQSGGIDVERVRTEGLVLSTQSGGIDIDASVTDVDAKTQSGGVDAILRPTGSGEVRLKTQSGGVDAVLIEDVRIGYKIEASTQSGGVDIRMEDGEAKGEKNHKTFETNGYASRAVKVELTAETQSGGVSIRGG